MTSTAYAKTVLSEMSSHSIFRFFPEVLDAFLKHGVVQSVNLRKRICVVNTPIKHLIIPIDGKLRLVLPTGRPGDERFLAVLDPLLPLCWRDHLQNNPYCLSAITEENCNILFVPSNIVNKVSPLRSPTENAIQLLISSSALRNFIESGDAKFKCGVKIANCLKTIDAPAIRLRNIEEVNFSGNLLHFIEDGWVVFEGQLQTGQTIHRVLRAGDWFGEPCFQKLFTRPPKLTFSKEMTIRQFAQSKLKSAFPNGEVPWEAIAPAWLEEAKRSAESSFKTSPRKRTRLTDLTMIELGYKTDPKKIVYANNSSEWPEMAVRNLAILNAVDLNLSNLKIFFDANERLSLGSFAEVLERHGFITRALRCEPSRLKRQKMPLLAFCNSRPYVILKVSGRQVYLLDPEKGIVGVHLKEFSQAWNGQALEAQRSPLEPILEDAITRHFLDDFRRITAALISAIYGKDSSGIYRNMFILGLVAALLEGTIPLCMEYIVGDILTSKNLQSLQTICIGIILIVFFSTVCEVISKLLSEMKLQRLQFDTQSYMIRQYLQTPPKIQGESRSYDMIAKLDLMQHLNETFHNPRIEIYLLGTVCFLYFLVIAAMRLDVAIVLAIGSLAMGNLKRFYVDQNLHELPGTTDLRQSAKIKLGEQIESTHVIKSVRGEVIAAKNTEFYSLGVTRLYLKLANKLNNGWGATGIITAVVYSISVYLMIGGGGFTKGKLEPGVFLAVMLFLGIFNRKFTGLTTAYGEYQFFKLESISYGYYARPNQEYSLPTIRNTRAIALKGDIRFVNVGFQYSGTNNFCLKEISFSIQPGKTIAIVGQSGAGKSTLVQMIAGQLRPQSGSIVYDEVDSRLLSLQSIRDQIGIVEQEPKLFADTFIANIAYGDDAPDIKRVEAAARASGANLFIESLPGGYHFFLHNNGRDLSAGMRTQISIARAIYKNPRILIIDEAGAHLDPISFKSMCDNVTELMEDRTVIFVTQRLQTLQKVDYVYVLKNGFIIESGTHNELIRNHREYIELFRAQVSTY